MGAGKRAKFSSLAMARICRKRRSFHANWANWGKQEMRTVQGFLVFHAFCRPSTWLPEPCRAIGVIMAVDEWAVEFIGVGSKLRKTPPRIFAHQLRTNSSRFCAGLLADGVQRSARHLFGARAASMCSYVYFIRWPKSRGRARSCSGSVWTKKM